MTGRGASIPRPVRRRAFTLLEIVIVIGVILTLMTLVLGVGSALLRNAEESQVESAMAIVESALNEYEAQMGRQMTFNGAWNTGGTQQVFPPGIAQGAGDALFDIRDPGPAAGSGAVMWAGRARGAGVFAVNLLRQVDSIRPILAGISAGLLRPEPNPLPGGPPEYPQRNIVGPGAALYVPSAKQTAGPRDSTRSELVDPWGGRIAFVFPGRAFRFGSDPGLPDADGTVRTPYENIFGVCANRRICLVSTGGDGLFGLQGEITPAAQDTPAARAAAAADNIYLYPLDPPQ